MEGSKIELEPHILSRLMSDKKIYNFQVHRTTSTNGLKIRQIGPTFLVPGKTVIFWGVKSVALLSVKKD